MIRLFSAIPVPPDLRSRIALLQGGIPGAKWHVPEDFHITLAFIGDVGDETAERAHEALAAVRSAAFSLSLQGAGLFSQGDDPNVLFLDVAQENALFSLKESVDSALTMANVPFHRRKYKPHMTLAYLKNPDRLKLAEFISAHALFRSGPFPVEEFILYQSRQSQQGAHYEALETYPLYPA